MAKLILVQPRARGPSVPRSRNGKPCTLSGLVLAVCLLGAACSSATLVPLNAEDGIASVRQGQLELRAEVRSGSYDVPDSITPIRIWVHNSSATGVYVTLHDISLVSDGSTSKPLDPSQLRPRPRSLGLDPTSPFVAPAQGAVGAAPVPETGAGAPVTSYSNTADATPFDPQRRAIQSSAFEGGFVAPGATERGMVYFPAPTRSGERLTLRVRVRSGDGVPLQVLEIPYSSQS